MPSSANSGTLYAFWKKSLSTSPGISATQMTGVLSSSAILLFNDRNGVDEVESTGPAGNMFWADKELLQAITEKIKELMSLV